MNQSRIARIIKSSLALLVLVALLAPSIHQWEFTLLGSTAHDHSHGETSCSPEAEQNPCHRKLVHHDLESDCAHDAHLSTQHVDCVLCGLLPLRQIASLPELNPETELHAKTITPSEELKTLPLSACVQSNLSRGPPARLLF